MNLLLEQPEMFRYDFLGKGKDEHLQGADPGFPGLRANFFPQFSPNCMKFEKYRSLRGTCPGATTWMYHSFIFT